MTSAATEFEGALRGALSQLAVPVTDGQVARLRTHFEAIVETNRLMNLTRITDPAEAAVKLVQQLQGKVIGVGFLVELSFLKGREKLSAYNADIFSLIQFASP